MDEMAGIFTVLVFLFYAAIAVAFIVAALRTWVWPFIREWLPVGHHFEREQRVHAADRGHSTP